MNNYTSLKDALETYKRNRIAEGENLEDIMDDIEEIVSDTIDKWCDENPIDISRNFK